MMYISVIELEIGVPVAKTMPCPPVSSSMYMHFIYMSLAFWLSVWEMPDFKEALFMKRVLAILLFVPFVMTLAPPCHAAGKGEVAVSLPTL